MINESDPPSQPAVDGVVDPATEEDLRAPFPVVGIGASAGGLEAFTGVLQHLPADTGMAFVFVQHLAPHHSSLLASILSRVTPMPVTEAEQETRVQPNHVYVIPPNTLMRIVDSVLELAPRLEERGAPRPIDYFFRSLAQDRRALGIGVLLSGSDSDGASGLRALRDEGGIAIVQSESSAKNPEMPHTAIAAGTADLILSPDEIGVELGRIARHPALAASTPGAGLRDELRASPERPEAPASAPAEKIPLHRLFQLLRESTGVDFRGYKPGTLQRRVARRMLLQHHNSLDSYLTWVESNRTELAVLSEDLLIHVTSFFRDKETFERFEKSVLPGLLLARTSRKTHAGTPFRVWVPGCSTGQEVYSIAICLMEAMSSGNGQFAVQIFGTDLSEHAVGAARNGVYPEAELAKISPERQMRYFTPCEGGFQVVKPIREMCVFARQNLLADPPFSRLNLISCRNLLIYLGHAAQREVIAAFHYALLSEGCLWLGHSESLRDFPELFSQIEKRQKFYTKKQGREYVGLQSVRQGPAGDRELRGLSPLPERETMPEAELERTAERIVLSEFGPAWILVNEHLDIVHSRGEVGPYLHLAPGRATLHLLRMARDEIRAELSKLLSQSKGGETSVRSSVLRTERNGLISETQIEVRRIIAQASTDAASFLVIFFPASPTTGQQPARKSGRGSAKAQPDVVERLRQELTVANQRLQAILSERDAAGQELISANEEIQSSNEELQSINEELETSKEELQSSNEELNTVNEELQNRNHELVRLSDDLSNLLSSTTIPIIMLDNDLRIRRVTPAAERLFNIRPLDVGRPISDLRLRLSEEDIDALVRRVIHTLAGEEIELLDRDGRWSVLRVRPYRTGDNRIEGAVLSLIDVDQIRRAQKAANTAREFAEALVESVQTPLLVIQPDLLVRTANRAFLALCRLRLPDIEGHPLSALGSESDNDGRPGHNQWCPPALTDALGRLSRGESQFENLEYEQEVSGLGPRTLLIDARRTGPDPEFQILLAATDITLQRRAERLTAETLAQTSSALHESEGALRRSREELRRLAGSLLNAQDEERRRVSRELHDDVSQNMAKLQFDIDTLEQNLPNGLQKEKTRLLQISESAGRLANDLRKIAYALHPSTLDHLGLLVALRAYGREFAARTGTRVKFSASGVPAHVPPEIASSFYRIAQEALRNVAKHAAGGTASIRLTGNATHLTLSIRDDGPGFDPSAVRGNGGLGLLSMEERARLIRASFQLETRPGKGAAIFVAAPLA